MNVRRQLFLQKWQRVSSLRVVRYSILRTASRPTKVVCWPLRHKRSDSCAAPIAPDSPQMLVDDDLRLLAGRAEAVADEIDFGLHDRQIVLRSALQHEARAQRREIGNAGNVQENVLRQHRRQAGENLFRPPALTLEVHDVGLHEHRAAVAEHRHGLRRECQIGVLLDAQAESFRGGLQEVSIARRALRVQLEIFHAAVVQDDDLDVLPAHIHDHVRIFVELQRRLGVRDGLHQRHVGLEHIFQNVLGVAGGGHAQHFELGALRFHLSAQVLEHLDRVLNRIAVRELVRLAEDVAVFVEQHGLGRSGSAVDADEAADRAVLSETPRA